jgi:hypothetical protein
MAIRSQFKGKQLATYKPFDPSPCNFVHSNLKSKKLSPYAGDIWVPALPVDQSRFVKIFVPSMEELFKPGDRIVRLEHAGVMSRLLWILEVDQAGVYIWIIESEDHMDFCDYS